MSIGAAVVCIPLNAVAEVMGMPKDWRVTAVVYDPATDGLMMRIEGQGLPFVDRGMVAPSLPSPILTPRTHVTWKVA